MKTLERAMLAVLAVAAGGAAGAASGGTAGRLDVAIELASSPSVCLSRSLADRTGAVVQVACPSGQFVAIAPARGLVGAQGSTFRYALGGVDAGWMEADRPLGQWGTVTALRVVNLDRQRLPIEMLVSF